MRAVAIFERRYRSRTRSDRPDASAAGSNLRRAPAGNAGSKAGGSLTSTIGSAPPTSSRSRRATPSMAVPGSAGNRSDHAGANLPQLLDGPEAPHPPRHDRGFALLRRHDQRAADDPSRTLHQATLDALRRGQYRSMANNYRQIAMATDVRFERSCSGHTSADAAARRGSPIGETISVAGALLRRIGSAREGVPAGLRLRVRYCAAASRA